MKLAKKAFLASTLSLIDYASAKGQLLDGTKVGAPPSTEQTYDSSHDPDNLASIAKAAGDYNLLLKRTGGVQDAHTPAPEPAHETVYSGTARNADRDDRHEKRTEDAKAAEVRSAELARYAADE